MWKVLMTYTLLLLHWQIIWLTDLFYTCVKYLLQSVACISGHKGLPCILNHIAGRVTLHPFLAHSKNCHFTLWYYLSSFCIALFCCLFYKKNYKHDGFVCIKFNFWPKCGELKLWSIGRESTKIKCGFCVCSLPLFAWAKRLSILQWKINSVSLCLETSHWMMCIKACLHLVAW